VSEVSISSEILPVAGVRLATASAGVRKAGRTDLCLIELAPGARTAGVFTQNVFCAAPVLIAKEYLTRAAPRAFVINSGNANAGTGEQGLSDARAVCTAAARLLGCEPRAVLPFSTGVIGQRLPAERIVDALPAAVAALDVAGWRAAAKAIMTTDTVPKCISAEFDAGGIRYTVTGIAKGAGMIKPNMATMLAYLATDANVAPSALQGLLRDVAARSFNRITIDGDTSTNDSCMLVATGARADGREMAPGHPGWPALEAAIEAVALGLSRAIVRDGEGATKLVTVRVRGASSDAECLKAAYAVAESPLVKTALFASDPNWGRILAAVGRSGVSGLAMRDIGIAFDEYPIIQCGEPVASYVEDVAAKILAKAEFDINIELGQGPGRAEVVTCDFSYDYVRINAEYRS
jgi:glutamate N-acetyltransferase/amino-acid N-acetyltransferase